MVIVAIIGVLATIAIPTYQDYVLSSNRSEAKSALQEAMNRQERYYTTNNEYTDNMTDLGYTNDPAETEDGWYQVSAQACGGELTECVRLEAAPQDNQTRDTCDTFWFNSRGQRGKTGTGDCW